MAENENVLKTKIDERNEKIEEILEKNQLEEVLSHSEMGDPGAIFARFAYVPPEKGGYADVCSDKDLFEHASMLVDEKIEEGAENSWELYESVGNEIRKDYGDDEDYKLYKDPGPSLQDRRDKEHSQAISDMAKARHQGIGD